MIKAFNEIKNRLFLLILIWLSLFLTMYYYKNFLLFFIIVTNTKISAEFLNYFIFTSITELFSIYFSMIIFITNQIVYFFLFYYLICFLSAGLYIDEYLFLKQGFWFSLIFFMVSLGIFFTTLLPVLSVFFLSFLVNSSQSINFYFEAKLSDYFYFYIETYYSCFISFQLCVILVLFSKYISNKIYFIRIARKFVYLILLGFSTVISPPDIFSQFFLFIFLVICFETTVLTSLFNKLVRTV